MAVGVRLHRPGRTPAPRPIHGRAHRRPRPGRASRSRGRTPALGGGRAGQGPSPGGRGPSPGRSAQQAPLLRTGVAVQNLVTQGGAVRFYRLLLTVFVGSFGSFGPSGLFGLLGDLVRLGHAFQKVFGSTAIRTGGARLQIR
jgi:hypothetical protein